MVTGGTNCKKVVTPDRIKIWINFLLDNLQVQVGDEIKRQTVGIPMGASCSPFLANLMLFMYEMEFFTDAISRALKQTHKQRRE